MNRGDMVDRAAVVTQRNLDIALQSRKSKDEDIKRDGRCNYCQEEIELPKIFCDGDCATDYDKYGPCEDY